MHSATNQGLTILRTSPMGQDDCATQVGWERAVAAGALRVDEVAG